MARTRKVSSSNYEWRLLAEFNLAGERGNLDLSDDGARVVAECVKDLHLPKARSERLKTAVKEAVANLFRRTVPEQTPLPLAIRVYVSEEGVAGGSPGAEPKSLALAVEAPRVEQTAASGWGFFLVEKMADAAQFAANLNGDRAKFEGPRSPLEPLHHTIELFLYREGESG